MIKADFHVHSNFSTDSKTLLENVVQKGISIGLKYLCITDHHDIDFPQSFDIFHTDKAFQLDFDSYFKSIRELQLKYSSKIDLLCGIELGIQPHLASKALEITNKYSFDFVLASSHLVDGIDPYNKEYYLGRTEDEAYSSYFKYIYENVKVFDDFDVYAHLDYPVRYGPSRNIHYSYRKYADEFDAIFDILKEKGKGIELNTAGIRKGLGYCHPQNDVLMRYKELGGEIITIGSDAHTAFDVAGDFDFAKILLENLGFKYYTIFKNRKAEFIKL
ncbi:MAG: hisK [Clostridiales bacterium]|jgi:histidinol-phosphatase (PHP family)|nr:hisK [Clostridiales bacterium]